MEENIGRLNSAIQSVRPGTPLILYYWKHQELVAGKVLGDQICDESQDRLSQGVLKIPPIWRPAYSMNRCRNCTGNKHPFGIIHSSPGMDWWHTGLPTAEYDFWLSLIPIFGGSLWHSVTGIPATITDKRILRSVAAANEKAGMIAPYMGREEHLCCPTVLCDDAYQMNGWMSVLHHTQKLYELMEGRRVTPETLHGKSAVLVPGAFYITKEAAAALYDYVSAGGHLILEGKIPEDCPELYEAAGIRCYQKTGGETVSAYLRFEEEGKSLQGEELQDTPIIPMGGKIILSEPEGAQILAALVPSFAPPDAVGAPPERASLPAPHTRIPLVTINKSGKGKCCNIQFGLSELIEKYGLDEHYELAHQLLNKACPPTVTVSRIHGLAMNAFRCPDGILIHLANGTGERPLKTVVPMTDIEVTVRLYPSEHALQVVRLFASQQIKYSINNKILTFVLDRLEVWESFLICLERE